MVIILKSEFQVATRSVTVEDKVVRIDKHKINLFASIARKMGIPQPAATFGPFGGGLED